MDKKKKKQIFALIIFISTVILIVIGSTFAYFNASVSSIVNAVSMTAAEFKVDLDDDTSLIKTSLIPSAELYVNRATIERLDEDKNFIKPYEENGEKVIAKTACIDDNLQEICSIYTFTIINTMQNAELPVVVTLNPTVNSFQNLYFKVVDENKNVVQEATHIIDDREYTLDASGNKIYEAGSRITPIEIEGIDVTLPKATIENGTVIPSTATYSIILWIMETGKDQTADDSKQVFAGAINIQAGGVDGGGITGMLTAGGEE